MSSSGYSQIFVVVGMHRSGTSLVTQCLESMGLKLSENLVPASLDNPGGFFEDAEIVRLNSMLEGSLEIDHMSLSSVMPVDRGWQDSPKISKTRAELKAYLRDSASSGALQLIKDPRLCRLLPIYFSIFEEIQLEPILFFVHRSPASVVRSKSLRDLLSKDIVLEQWKRANFDALASIYEYKSPVCFVSYDNLVLDRNSVFKRIQTFIQSTTKIEANLGSLPFIQVESFPEKVKSDQSVVCLDEISVRLNEFLLDVGDERLSGYPTSEPFGVLYEAFRGLKSYHQVVLDYCLKNRSQINSPFLAAQREIRKGRELAIANGKLFGLRGQLDVVKSELEQVRKKGLKKDGSITRLTELLQSRDERITELDEHLQSLLRKHNTRIFVIADKLQNFKTLKLVIPFRKIRRKIKSTYYSSRSYTIKIRRHLNNNGVKQTIFVVAREIRKKMANVKPAFGGTIREGWSPSEIEQFDREIKKALPDLSLKQRQWLDRLFIAEFYKSEASLDQALSRHSALKHFLEQGISEGYSPGPMFSSVFCSQVMGLDNPQGCFLSWLRDGAERRINPSPIFDEDYYVGQINMDLLGDEWSFSRYVRVGVYNNASPNQYFDSNWYVQNHEIAQSNTLPALYHYLIVGYKLGWRPSAMFPAFSRAHCSQIKISPLETVMSETKFLDYRSRFRQGGILTKLFNEAAKLEPKLLGSGSVPRLNIQPFNNPYYPALKEIRSLLGKSTFDSIVLIPHCRYGGSGLVAGELCRSLLRLKPDESVLLVRTDNDDFMRPDWFPENIEVLNLRDFSVDMPDLHRARLLLDILIGTKPSRIFNVHSRLAWEVFVRYGDRLRLWSQLIGYSFCYDLSISGRKVGYPVKYVPDSFSHLDRLFVDNHYLKNDLLNTTLSHEDAQKIVVLPTPYQTKVVPVVRSFGEKPHDIQSKKIFWAGRFDRQKKFDVVLYLASRNPDLEFHVWGAAMLGDNDPISNAPENIVFHGLYESYEEIPFEDCDLWLYTSLWDGVPTILIELGLREVPVVASEIWGTSDLISEKTAWPVKKVHKPKAYQRILDEALRNPAESRRRAKEFRKLVLERHSRENYDSLLGAQLNVMEVK